MARLTPLLFLMVLTGCVTDNRATVPVADRYPDIATIKAERDATTNAYVLCLMRNARDLDDGRSEPGSIATAAISACGAEFNANVDAYSRYLQDGLEGRKKVATATRESGYGAASEFVLKHRNGTLKVPQ